MWIGVPLHTKIEIISHIVKKFDPFNCCEKRLPVKDASFNFLRRLQMTRHVRVMMIPETQGTMSAGK